MEKEFSAMLFFISNEIIHLYICNYIRVHVQVKKKCSSWSLIKISTIYSFPMEEHILTASNILHLSTKLNLHMNG